MSDPFLGEIRIFAGTFAPQGWAFCQGQILPIAQYTALFSLLGTTYGGNGQSNFALPNLAGRVVLGLGTSTTGTNYVEGQVAGTESVTLNANNLPAHTHGFALQCSNGTADQTDPTGAIPAQANPGGSRPTASPSYTKSAATGSMAAQQTNPAGGNQPVANMQPYLVINYIIAMQGVYPSRP